VDMQATKESRAYHSDDWQRHKKSNLQCPSAGGEREISIFMENKIINVYAQQHHSIHSMIARTSRHRVDCFSILKSNFQLFFNCSRTTARVT